LLTVLGAQSRLFTCQCVLAAVGLQEAELRFQKLLTCLSHPPSYTCVRASTHLAPLEDIRLKLEEELKKLSSEVVVGAQCGSAVLRGAHVFAPGIIASPKCVQMVDPLYQSPSFDGVLPSLVFLQNLPSVVVGHVLAPRPGEWILDMCAAPGGKTCHIAALMGDKVQ
ncbi:hypothetical protein GOODEAATRI_005528, partial [Goodea atripinnis]